MDISNLKLIKDNLVEVKESGNKVIKTSDSKQGCIKLNDYFSF
jgi:hypothetical protein